MNTPWVGGVVVISALLLTRLSGALDKRENKQIQQTACAELS